MTEWSEDFSIGIEEIDRQHKGFFEAAHRLYDHILNCRGERVVEETVEFLRDYAAQHFRAEESFMQEHGFPRIEEHKRLHAQFFEGLDALMYDLSVFGPSQHLANRALEIVQDWLIHHITDEDAQYAAYVRGSADRGSTRR